MKKIILIICLVFLGAAVYWYEAIRIDYKKIMFILPSSKLASSPYYYKKDGDYFLANDLKSGFEKLGYKVTLAFREDYDNLKLGNIGNMLYFKGYYEFKELPGVEFDKRKRVLYLYYMEGLHPEIFNDVDITAAASHKIIQDTLSLWGAKAVYVPQFTNPERFKPLKDMPLQYGSHKVLFVGSNHSGKGRKSVEYAIKNGFEPLIYGKFWDKLLTPKHLKSNFIDNDKLSAYYSKADVVLNDHRADMLYYGFISNRIYDVTAAGGFIFTDYQPEIEKIYGDSIATYKDEQEFRDKLAYYLAFPEVREKMIKKARAITLNNFTNTKIAQTFDEIFKNIKK